MENTKDNASQIQQDWPHMNSKTVAAAESLHRSKPEGAPGGSGHELPPLSKKITPIIKRLQRKKMFSNEVSLGIKKKIHLRAFLEIFLCHNPLSGPFFFNLSGLMLICYCFWFCFYVFFCVSLQVKKLLLLFLILFSHCFALVWSGFCLVGFCLFFKEQKKAWS